MSDETIITRNGMEVHCYGEWDEYSNCFIVGEWSNGWEMDEVWAGDGWDVSEEGKEYPACCAMYSQTVRKTGALSVWVMAIPLA